MPLRPAIELSRLATGLACGLVLGLATGCAGLPHAAPSGDVDAAAFADWPCVRLRDEIDSVQYRAANLAWRVDRRSGRHIVELGLGLAVYWPALTALQPEGADGQALAGLKRRFDALQTAARAQACTQTIEEVAAGRLAGLPVRPGERLVYEEQRGVREPLHEQVLHVLTLRQDEIEFAQGAAGRQAVWRQDMAGNVTEAPEGSLVWQRLLHQPLALGDVVADELRIVGQPTLRARIRGQVVALGPLRVAGRALDAAVIELFGDVPLGETSTGLDGSLVVDRAAGLLLRLELNSAQPAFRLQQRLVRVERPR